MRDIKRWTTFLFTAALLEQDPIATGLAQFHQGKYEAAKTTLEQALKQKPGDEYARTFLALARAATGGCDAVSDDLANLFKSNKGADLRRMAGLALAQCHVARSRV